MKIMSRLQVRRELSIKQFSRFRLMVWHEFTKFSKVIIDVIINKGFAFHRDAVSFDEFNA